MLTSLVKMSQKNGHNGPGWQQRSKATKVQVCEPSCFNHYHCSANRQPAELTRCPPKPHIIVNLRQGCDMEESDHKPEPSVTVTEETPVAMVPIAPAISKLDIAPAPVVANSCVEANDSKDATPSDPKSQVVVKLPTHSTTTHSSTRRVTPRPPLPLYTPPRQRNNQCQNRGRSFPTRQGRALGSEYRSQRKVAQSFPTPLFSYTPNEPFEAEASTVAQSIDQTGSGTPAGKKLSQAALSSK